MLHIYLAAFGALLFAQATPGPNFVAVTSTALGEGRRPALFMTLGIATITFLWCAVSVLGLSALLKLYPNILTLMKIIGGAYLCFLAVKALRSAWTGTARTIIAERAHQSDFAAYRRGALINLTNPKSAAFWVAFVSSLLGLGLTPWQVAVFAPVGTLSALAIYATYSTLFSSGMARNFYSRFARLMNAAFGVIFALFGGALLFDGLKSALAR